jgi:hypothetical protein
MERSMKRIVLLFVLALGLWPLFSAQAQQMCFQDRRVVAVTIGQVELYMGADGGDAVYFRLDNNATRWYPLNKSFNLDHNRGQALYKMLMTAMAGGYRIRAYDHYYPYCDDVDQIEIYR